MVRGIKAQEIVALDPEGEIELASKRLAERVDSLNSKVIGLLVNNPPRSLDFKRIEELVRERYHPAEVIYRRKPASARPAPKEMINELVEKCDLVINTTCQ